MPPPKLLHVVSHFPPLLCPGCLQCVGAGTLTTGPNAGACTSFAVRYDKVLGQEADVGIVNAGGVAGFCLGV